MSSYLTTLSFFNFLKEKEGRELPHSVGKFIKQVDFLNKLKERKVESEELKSVNNLVIPDGSEVNVNFPDSSVSKDKFLIDNAKLLNLPSNLIKARSVVLKNLPNKLPKVIEGEQIVLSRVNVGESILQGQTYTVQLNGANLEGTELNSITETNFKNIELLYLEKSKVGKIELEKLELQTLQCNIGSISINNCKHLKLKSTNIDDFVKIGSSKSIYLEGKFNFRKFEVDNINYMKITDSRSIKNLDKIEIKNTSGLDLDVINCPYLTTINTSSNSFSQLRLTQLGIVSLPEDLDVSGSLVITRCNKIVSIPKSIKSKILYVHDLKLVDDLVREYLLRNNITSSKQYKLKFENIINDVLRKVFPNCDQIYYSTPVSKLLKTPSR